jgi:hypothetical protein
MIGMSIGEIISRGILSLLLLLLLLLLSEEEEADDDIYIQKHHLSPPLSKGNSPQDSHTLPHALAHTDRQLAALETLIHEP